MSDAEHKAYELALARFLDGEPEPGDADLIVRVLRGSAERRREVSGLIAVDDLLRQRVDEPAAFTEALQARLEAEDSGAAFLTQVEQNLDERPARKRRWAWAPWVAVGLAAAVAIAGWWPRSPAPDATKNAVTGFARSNGQEVFALLVNDAGAKFTPGAAPHAVSFGRGEYRLEEGAAHLRFRNGADVVVVAPARFAIDDALRVRMDEGNLRAFVPASAHGFMVAAPGVRFRDLGTEFGVSVDAASGQSRLHVFDGEVEVLRDGQNRPEATLTGGESVRIRAGVMTESAAPVQGEFPTPGEISVRRWAVAREALRQDPNLVLYYPFARDDAAPEILRDDSSRAEKIDGRIEGAEWVTGRWPGKQALQFEHPGDAVALRIPGEFDALSMAAWIKVDRFEHTMNIILSSVGWREGGVQWQIDRRGNPAPTSVFSVPKRQPLWTGAMIPVGRWVHCVVTIDRATGRILHYINGRHSGTAQVAPGSVLRPSLAHIARWDSDNKKPDRRDFRGRIDELAVWNVVLPPDRIASLAEAGMPIDLPDARGGVGANSR